MVLAAGYATRLYPETRDVPKALLPVGGRPFLDRVLSWLLETVAAEHIVVVCNSRFARQFHRWRDTHTSGPPVSIVEDGTSTNEDRLGAVGDLALAISSLPTPDDLLVTGADRHCELDIGAMARESSLRGVPFNLCIETGSKERIRGRHGCATVAEDNRITGFQEKPADPGSTLMSVACYSLPREMLGLVDRYLREGRDRDSLGGFLGWMASTTDVYAWISRDSCLEIGSPEALAAARRHFSTDT